MYSGHLQSCIHVTLYFRKCFVVSSFFYQFRRGWYQIQLHMSSIPLTISEFWYPTQNICKSVTKHWLVFEQHSEIPANNWGSSVEVIFPCQNLLAGTISSGSLLLISILHFRLAMVFLQQMGEFKLNQNKYTSLKCCYIVLICDYFHFNK